MANGTGPAGGDGLVQRLLDRGFEFFSRSIWELELGQLSWAGRRLIKVARIAYLAASGFVDKRCMVRASALTYITMLSIVPLLAFVFSVAKGFGFYRQLRETQIDPFLDGIFATQDVPEGQGVRATLDTVLDLVQQTDFTKLAWGGAAILAYTVVRLLGTVERSLNEIWGVRRQRRFVRKLADYLSMVTITPILLFTGAGLIAAARNNALVSHTGLDVLLELALKLGSGLIVWIGFSFLYKAMPNTHVPLRSALLGAAVAAVLWLGVQWLHVKFQIGVANYSEIYSGFAALPIFMVWINLCWIVVLLGATVAYAHQAEPTQHELRVHHVDTHAFIEVVALRAAARIARAFVRGDAPPTAGELALELALPVRSLNDALGRLEACGILADTERGDGDDMGCLPARPPETITVRGVLRGLRGSLDATAAPANTPLDRELESVREEIERVVTDSGADRSLNDLVDGER
jgi:membrane protein